MKLYTDLKLRFDTPIWGLHPEIALFDVLLDKKPWFRQKDKHRRFIWDES